jgi:hypothetical protein
MGDTGDARALAVLASETTYGRHPWIREKAVWGLGEMARRKKEGTGGAVRRLTELLEDPAFRVRRGAADQLKDVGDLAAAEALERLGPKEFDGRLRKSMRVAAAKIREKGR